jgi:hypothetical protein
MPMMSCIKHCKKTRKYPELPHEHHEWGRKAAGGKATQVMHANISYLVNIKQQLTERIWEKMLHEGKVVYNIVKQ